MLSADDHSGVFSFMLGIIVLVMAGVGLSLVIDKRLKYSSGSVKFEKEMILETSELEGLIARREDAARHLGEAEKRHGSVIATGVVGPEEMETMKEWKSVLQVTQERLRESIIKLDKDFAEYRTDYLRRLRQSAIGESLGNITLRNGREYKQVTINQVTDVGLEIRHADGIARIKASDLDKKMQDRFQWTDVYRRKILKSETEIQIDVSAGEVERGAEAPAETSEPITAVERRLASRGASEAAELPSLRRAVSDWRSRVEKLSADRAEAQSRASYGNQASVPGRLETWTARSERIGNELLRAQDALTLAEANLAAVAPNDPLLKPKVREF
jgi:hypothetical protein